MIFVSVPIGWFAIIPKIDIVQGFWRVDINWNIVLAVYLAGVDIEKIFEGYMTPRNVAADGFFHSDEFIAKNTTNAEYVSILYQTFLGRELDEPGYELWVGLLDRNEWTRDQVLDGFALSDEFTAILASFGL